MNLKKLLHGNSDQLLTARDYRIASQMRVHAGKMLLTLTPLVAIGAVLQMPLLMIPALYMPTALLIPPINFGLLKTVSLANGKNGTGRGAALFRKRRKTFWIASSLLAIPGYFILSAIFFPHLSFYQKHHGWSGHEYQFQQHHGWTLTVAGLLMTGVCVWLSFTLIQGRRTQSMQRIALHLAAQEAENA